MLPFDNSFARLPDGFFARLNPTPVGDPSLIKLNERVAALLELDLDFLKSDSGIAMLAGNDVPQGAEPLAMAYAGHQFGGWAPQLGDGRALLLGELIGSDDRRYDLQLKGSGRTPFSRGGDGRAWLGPVLREYLISEAMHGFGIPSTLALAAVATGEAVLREGYMPGAILARVSKSHVRVGTFEFFSARQDITSLATLTDYAIQRFYPEAAKADCPPLALLKGVIEKTAPLVAAWQSVGFIHGVMNTDNMNISGETIDYGPCAFMDSYDAGKVFSSIDYAGRYCYSNQPKIAQWNLAVLAQCLMPLINENQDTALALAQESIDAYPGIYQNHYDRRMNNKLGLTSQQTEDQALAENLLEIMESGAADFTLTFSHLTAIAACDEPVSDKTTATESIDPANNTNNFLQLFNDTTDARDQASQWLTSWQQRRQSDTDDSQQSTQLMRQSNPAVVPRNHRVEEAIQAAITNDFSVFEDLLSAVQDPYRTGADSDRPGSQASSKFEQPPTTDQLVTQTFCGT